MAYKKRRSEEEWGNLISRDWGNLPGNVLYEILERLDCHADATEDSSRIDTNRIRSVCTCWRSSVFSLKPPLHLSVKFPTFPVHFFFKFPDMFHRHLQQNKSKHHPISVQVLKRSTFFLVSPPASATVSVGNNQSNVWLIKVLEPPPSTSNTVFKLQNLVLINSSPPTSFLKVSLDIFSCPVEQIARSYVLECEENGESKCAKVVLIWNSFKEGKTTSDCDWNFSAMALFPDGDLGLWKPGIEDWIHIVDDSFSYKIFSDIIAFEGKFYATDKKGKVLIIDPATFKWTDITPKCLTCCYGSYLVESNASLYLVVKVFDQEYWEYFISMPIGNVSVYRLESGKEDNGARWNPVDRQELEDRVFFISEYATFSMSPQQLGWSKGNRIVFALENSPTFIMSLGNRKKNFNQFYRNYFRYMVNCLSVYNFENRRFSVGRCLPPQISKTFWPPPDWLLSEHSKQHPNCLCFLCTNQPYLLT